MKCMAQHVFHQVSKQKIVTTFSATASQDPRLWLDNFDTYCNRYRLIDDEKVLAFSMLMQGDAAIWYYDLTLDQQKTWPQLKEAFAKTFLAKPTYINVQDNLLLKRRLRDIHLEIISLKSELATQKKRQHINYWQQLPAIVATAATMLLTL